LKDPAFDPERSVIFSEMPTGLGAAAPAAEMRVAVIEKGINSDRLQVEASQPAVLVVSQMFYPGWKATVDGAEAGVYPVDVALNGILIPSGAHEVRLFFQPATLRIGLLLSLGSAVIVGLLLLWRK